MLQEPDIISDMKDSSQQQTFIVAEKLKLHQQHNQPNTNGNAHVTNNGNASANNNGNESANNNNGNESAANVEMSAAAVEPNKTDLPVYNFPPNVNVLKCNNQIKELHTVIRDKETTHSDFKFYSDRLIRLLVEEGLNELPYTSLKVITPAGCEYEGVNYKKGICGVSIMRSGEAMEKGLRECCRSIRIGKILIQPADEDARKNSVVYAKFPNDICQRKILLMYPIMTTGSTVNLAIQCLKDHNVLESNIILLILFSTPTGLQSVSSKYPTMHILTSEVHPHTPYDFGQRYFGTA